MKNKIFTAFLLLVSSVVSADHEYIVVPEKHSPSRHSSEQHSHKGQSSERHTPQSDKHFYLSRPYITPYIAVGIGAGGDVIGRFTDSFGDVETVRGGGGLLLEGGVLLAVDRYTHLRFTGGIEVDSVDRANGQSSFDRARFDLMMLRNFGYHEFGVGLTAHTGVGYSCDINAICAGDVDFDSAIGYTAEYALTTNAFHSGQNNRRLNPLRNARLGLRFTDIEYRPQLPSVSSPEADVVDGTSLSLIFGFSF